MSAEEKGWYIYCPDTDRVVETRNACFDDLDETGDRKHNHNPTTHCNNRNNNPRNPTATTTYSHHCGEPLYEQDRQTVDVPRAREHNLTVNDLPKVAKPVLSLHIRKPKGEGALMHITSLRMIANRLNVRLDATSNVRLHATSNVTS